MRPSLLLIAVLFLATATFAQSTPTATLTASNPIAGAELGTAVAISGSTVASGGAAFVNGGIQGVVYVFTKAASAPWSDMTESAELVVSNRNVGGTVGMSGDGNTIVSISTGAVDVFVKPAGGWKGTISPAATLVQATPAKPWIVLGDLSSIAINAKGDTIVAGAFDAGTTGHHSEGKAVPALTEQGAVYVWVEPSGGWASASEPILQTATLIPAGSIAYDHFGWSIGIFANTIVVGAPANALGLSSNDAAAYLFTRPSSGIWHDGLKFQSRFTASDESLNDAFGYSVATGDSGSLVAVGSRRGCGSSPGAAYIFARPPQWWPATTTQTAELSPSDASGACFGAIVTIAGAEVLVGAPNALAGAGSAYSFVQPANGWTNTSLAASMVGGSGSIQFGNSVSVGGRTTAIGAPGANINGTQAGAVYIFSN